MFCFSDTHVPDSETKDADTIFYSVPKVKKHTPNDDETKFLHLSLNNIIFFRKIDMFTRRQLVKHMWLEHIHDTQVLIHQGMRSNDVLYIVNSGSFHTMIKKDLTLFRLKKATKGQCLGLLEFFTVPRNQHNVIASQESTVWILHLNDFHKYIKPASRGRYSIDTLEDNKTKTTQKKLLDKIEIQIQVLFESISFFDRMEKKDIFRLIDISDFFSFNENIVVSSHEEKNKTFYIIEYGEADLYIEGDYYKTLCRTNFFGDLNFFKRKIPFTVISRTKLNVVAFSEHAFWIALKPIHHIIFDSLLSSSSSDSETSPSSIEKKNTHTTMLSNNFNITCSIIHLHFLDGTNKQISSPNFEISEFMDENGSIDDIHEIKFLFQQEIGKGQYGKVFRATCKQNNKQYAIKCIDKTEKTYLEQYVVQESLITSSIISNFCVRKYASFQDNESVYIIFQYIPYNLIDFLQSYHQSKNKKEAQKKNQYQKSILCVRTFKSKKRLTVNIEENIIRFYAACLVLGLEYLHKNNIIYRDLKPENILVDEHGYALLSDFSFVKKLEREEKTYTLCGSYGFMAPEILQGHGYTKRVDSWSLGVTIYFLHTLKNPYNIPPCNSYVTLTKRSHDPNFQIQFPEKTSYELRDLIFRLTQFTPQKRLPIYDENYSLRRHPFFKNINWDFLLHKKYHVHWKNLIADTSSTYELENF